MHRQTIRQRIQVCNKSLGRKELADALHHIADVLVATPFTPDPIQYPTPVEFLRPYENFEIQIVVNPMDYECCQDLIVTLFNYRPKDFHKNL